MSSPFVFPGPSPCDAYRRPVLPSASRWLSPPGSSLFAPPYLFRRPPALPETLILPPVLPMSHQSDGLTNDSPPPPSRCNAVAASPAREYLYYRPSFWQVRRSCVSTTPSLFVFTLHSSGLFLEPPTWRDVRDFFLEFPSSPREVLVAPPRSLFLKRTTFI